MAINNISEHCAQAAELAGFCNDLGGIGEGTLIVLDNVSGGVLFFGIVAVIVIGLLSIGAFLAMIIGRRRP